MAAICRSTYDIDLTDINGALNKDSVTTFIQCAMILNENTPLSIDRAPLHLQLLLRRDQRLSHRLEGHIRRFISIDRTCFDTAVLSVWDEYRPVSSSLYAPTTSRWIVTFTSESELQSSQRIHYNLIEGKLLVDGKSVGRLPREIADHPTYLRLFGQVRIWST
jgi:hypothetical protein